MSFMKETVNSSMPIWNECIQTPFVQELKNGTLSFDKFKGYMIQDSIYLKHYARIYGKAIYLSTNLRDIQLYYSILSFVTDTESAVRLGHLKQFDLTDDDIELIAPLSECQNYIDFMLAVAERGNINEILMCVLPCMLSYSYIFRGIAADPVTKGSRYLDFIQDYADEKYHKDCLSWTDFADEKCALASSAEKENLKSIFEKASLFELDFWKMAYRG